MPTIIKSSPKAREKPCLRCGYSLRKITDSRNCPECGLPIWISLNNNDSLDWSRPEWLRLLRTATAIMAASQLLGLLSIFLLIYPGIWGYHVMAWIISTYLLSLNTGLLLLSLPERRYPDRLKPYRWFLLISASLGLLLALSILTYSALGRTAPLRHGYFLGLIDISLLLSALATLSYLRKLSHRLAAHRLAKLLGFLLLLPLLKLFQSFPFCGLYLAHQFLPLTTLLPWLYTPISLLILIYLSIQFHHAAKEADTNWAKAG